MNTQLGPSRALEGALAKWRALKFALHSFQVTQPLGRPESVYRGLGTGEWGKHEEVVLEFALLTTCMEPGFGPVLSHGDV